MIHLKHCLEHGLNKFQIKSVYSDVVVLAVYTLTMLKQQMVKSLALIGFGTGKDFKHIPGPHKSLFHPCFMLSWAVILCLHLHGMDRRVHMKHGEYALLPLKLFLHFQYVQII